MEAGRLPLTPLVVEETGDKADESGSRARAPSWDKTGQAWGAFTEGIA